MNGRAKRTGEESGDGPTADRELLRRFIDHDDEDAFARLVSRYCGLVLGVCRRTLRDEHSAEDAFQATFLVLARRAPQIRNRSSLAGWLYAVAYRAALRAKAKRHRRREEALRDDMTATDDILARVTSRYEQQLLDEELHRLPPKYREPLVLRYLMGKSNKQVACELGLTVGVVEGRLKRGKDRLRLSLARRGISLTVALAAVGLSARALEAAATDSLVAATVQTAAAFRTGAQPAGDYSQGAIRLAEKELAMGTSALATTTSGVAVALVIAGLTLALPGHAAQQPARAEDAGIAATAQTALPAALSPEGSHVPVRLAAAEKRKTESAPQSALSSAEKEIEEALRGPATLKFIDSPLQDVIGEIADMHKINIVIDQRALDDVGIPSDCPITFDLTGVSLQSGLKLMLRDLDLTWTIRDEVLLITTPEEAEMMLIVKVYDVGDLVTCQDKSGELWADYDGLIELIKTTVEPDTWDDVGGPGSIAEAPFGGAEMLAVSQTYQVHQRIERLLDQLRAITREKGSGEPPVREKLDWRPANLGWPPGGTPGGVGKPPADDAAQQPATTQSPPMAAAVPLPLPAAPSAEDGDTPVRPAAAEKPTSESDANDPGGPAKLDEAAKREAILRAKYGAVDMKSRPIPEDKILETLTQPTVLEFIDTPLMDVLATLKDYHRIEIRLDRRALEDVGIPPDTPITDELRGVSLRPALRLLLRDLDLTFVVVDEVLLITTPEVADAMMETHIYSLHWLADFDSEELAKVIQNTIRPDTWRTGAPADEPSSSSTAEASEPTRRAAIEALPGCLVITQSQHAHEEIADLFKQLDRYASGDRTLRKALGD